MSGCAIVCVSIVVGISVTFAVALIDDVTGLAVPQEAVSIAFFVNGALVAAGAAFGGWAPNGHVADRVSIGLFAAGAALAIYVVLFGFIGYFIFLDYL
jgi:hypothetical protein